MESSLIVVKSSGFGTESSSQVIKLSMAAMKLEQEAASRAPSPWRLLAGGSGPLLRGPGRVILQAGEGAHTGHFDECRSGRDEPPRNKDGRRAEIDQEASEGRGRAWVSVERKK